MGGTWKDKKASDQSSHPPTPLQIGQNPYYVEFINENPWNLRLFSSSYLKI